MAPSAWANSDDSNRSGCSSEAEYEAEHGGGDVEMPTIRSRHTSCSPTKSEDDREARHFKYQVSCQVHAEKSETKAAEFCVLEI